MKLQEAEAVAALCGVEPANVEKKEDGTFLVYRFGIRFAISEFAYGKTDSGLQLANPLAREHIYGDKFIPYPADGGAPIFAVVDQREEVYYDFYRWPIWSKTLGRADYRDFETPIIGDRENWLKMLSLAYDRTLSTPNDEPRQDPVRLVIPATTAVKSLHWRVCEDKSTECLPRFGNPIYPEYYNLLSDYAIFDSQIEDLELRQDDELYYVVGTIGHGLVLPMARLWTKMLLEQRFLDTPPDCPEQTDGSCDEGLFADDQLEPW